MSIPINIILLIPEITKGMKSIGSKSLLQINQKETILDYQIKYIKKFYKKSHIYLLTGFDSEKIEKKTSKYSNITIVYNNNYEHSNQAESLIQYITGYNPDNCLIINNGVLLKEKLLIKNNNSTIFTSCKNHTDFNIGISHNNENKNRITYLFYGLPNQWIECVFLDREAINTIHHISKKRKLSNLFLFELLNLVLDNGLPLYNYPITNNKNILKINNHNDIKKTKGFYDKNLFAKSK